MQINYFMFYFSNIWCVLFKKFSVLLRVWFLYNSVKIPTFNLKHCKVCKWICYLLWNHVFEEVSFDVRIFYPISLRNSLHLVQMFATFFETKKKHLDQRLIKFVVELFCFESKYFLNSLFCTAEVLPKACCNNNS